MLTPPSDAGIPEGITPVRHRLPVQGLPGAGGDQDAAPEDMLTADEVFLTGLAAEIIAVTQIDPARRQGEHHAGDARISEGEGPITSRLR